MYLFKILYSLLYTSGWQKSIGRNIFPNSTMFVLYKCGINTITQRNVLGTTGFINMSLINGSLDTHLLIKAGKLSFHKRKILERSTNFFKQN